MFSKNAQNAKVGSFHKTQSRERHDFTKRKHFTEIFRLFEMGVFKEIHIIEPHWEHVFHTEKKEMLTIFMGLQRHGIIKPHFTMHDMVEYLAYQEREAFMDRSCQMIGVVDGPACLIWEVNVLIKLLDIQREIDQEPLEVKEPSTALAIPSEISSFSSPLWAVQMAVKVMGYRFIYRPFAQEHHISEIVVDVVARLVHAMEVNLADAANHTLCLFLRAKAGSIAVQVLRKLPQDRVAYYTHLTSMRIVKSLQRKLNSMKIMKKAASCDSDELMAVLTDAILGKLLKHFCSISLPLEPGNILTLLLKASERKYPAASMKLVIHADTVTSILVFVLRLVFPDEDDIAAQLHAWPVLDEVVDRLAICGGRVSRGDRKDSFHIHIKEIIDMARSVYEQLLEGSGGIHSSLQHAVAGRARMFSRDFANLVSEAILKSHQARIDGLVGTSEKEEDPCLHQKNVLRSLVARFVCELFPASDSLVKCFQLADQLCALIQQDITDKEAALPRSLDELQESTLAVIQEIAGWCHSGHLLLFPVTDGWDIASFLADKEHCMLAKDLIVKSIIHYFKDILFARDEEKRRKAEQEAALNAKDPEDTLLNVEEENEAPVQVEEECDAHITSTTGNPDTINIASTVSSQSAVTPTRGFFRRMWRAVCCCCCATSQKDD